MESRPTGFLPGPGAIAHDPAPGEAVLGLRPMFRRQVWWIAGTAVLVCVFSIWVTLRQPPVFEARATLRIEPPSTPAANPLQVTGPGSTIGTELEILRSRTVAEHVIDSLRLQVVPGSPAQTRPERFFRRLAVTRAASGGAYAVVSGPGGLTVTGPGGVVRSGGYGEPIEVEGVIVEADAAADLPGRVEFTVTPRELSAEALRSGLRVMQAQPNVGVVTLVYESADPVLARDIANGLARAYVSLRNDMQKEQARRTVSFLAEQVDTIGDQLAEAEGALEEFRRTRFVVAPQAQADERSRRFAELQVEREQVELDRAALRELAARAADSDSLRDWAAYASSPPLARNNVLSGILQQLAELETERVRLRVWRTSEDPDVAGIERAMLSLRRRLGLLVAEQLASTDSERRSQDSVLATLATELRGVPQSELEYARLRRNVDLLNGLHSLLQTRLKEAEIAEAIEFADVQVVDSAIVAATPIRPNRRMSLAFGLSGGILLGLVVGLVREVSDTRVRRRDELARLTQLPVLATIPGAGVRRGLRSRPGGRLPILNAPQSPAAEAYRGLRTSMAVLRSGRATVRTVLVTSTGPEDGKTTTAANLAVSFAELGKRVILLDADQRRPRLHRELGTDRSPGLTELLLGMADLETAEVRIPLPEHASGELRFIPSGKQVPNPADLVASASMRALLLRIAEANELVVLDTPPLSVVTDAAVLGTMVDAAILVARSGSTTREALRQAVQELLSLGVPVAGTVLTDAVGTDRYGQYYYRYSDAD